MSGEKMVAIVVPAMLLWLLLHGNFADAANYTVGDAQGWSFNAQNWPAGKTFKAGDTL
ncbi:unnamed protein product, partial [Ilex paraguariensis]